MSISLRNQIGRWAVRTAACIALSAAAGGAALAQEIEPNEFVPAPAGTNLAIGYYVYGHNTELNVAKGSTIKNSSLEVNVGILRLVHFTELFGHPAGVQVLEAFGNLSDGNVGGVASLGSATGASNLNLSAFYWFIADTQAKQYLNTAIFLYPPVGTYDKYSPLNLATAFGNSYNWSGDWQLGWDNGIGENFSYDLAFDLSQAGDVTGPGGTRTTYDTSYRLQAWANWNWTRAFQTSIGWESMLGGDQTTNGSLNGNKTEYERLRGAVSLFVAPNAQILLEVNHDFVHVGGFRQSFGATGRVVYVF